MTIIDISHPLTAGTAEWPGDQPFELSWTMRQDRGDSVNVAAIKMSVHCGTHTDAGFHVVADGKRAAGLPLDAYIGQALVIDARGRSALDESVLSDVDLDHVRRILFRTRDSDDPSVFPERFLTPSPALARRLVAARVRLIGSDAPSMDEATSKTLEAHHILIDGGVAILENLALSNVVAGVYTLIALPLKLVEADASPVRAVLVDNLFEDA
jgi:arylformamidase